MTDRRPWSRRRGPRPDRTVLNPQSPDLAACLIELARPLVPLGGDATSQDWRRALIMAVAGWNTSLVPSTLDELIERSTDDPDARKALRLAAETVSERKALLFPHDRRVIVDWRFEVGAGGEATLKVASADPE